MCFFGGKEHITQKGDFWFQVWSGQGKADTFNGPYCLNNMAKMLYLYYTIIGQKFKVIWTIKIVKKQKNNTIYTRNLSFGTSTS